jgi:hypothetical protein
MVQPALSAIGDDGVPPGRQIHYASCTTNSLIGRCSMTDGQEPPAQDPTTIDSTQAPPAKPVVANIVNQIRLAARTPEKLLSRLKKRR